MIKKIKIKAMFDNGAEVNCMFKWLTDVAQLSMCQNINIIMIDITDKWACFFDICETVFISIGSITISIYVFIVKRSDYELLLESSFQRVARMSSINRNDEFLKIILHSLNEKKRMSFLKMSAEHVSNKKEEFVFAIKLLNV